MTTIENKFYFYRQSRLIFYQLLGLGLGGLFLFLGLFFIYWPQGRVLWRSWNGQLAAACGCYNHFSFIHHPFIFSSLLIGGGGLLLFLGLVMFKTIKVHLGTRKFISTKLKQRRKDLSSKLASAVRFLDLEHKVVEINEQLPLIFCYNFFRPKICVTSFLVRRLSLDELKTVLIHEKHHLLVYDPIKLFLVKIMSRILFFLPGMGLLAHRYLVFSELAADERATDCFQNKAPLARALAKIINWQERLLIKDNLAVSFFGAVLKERVERLMSDDYRPSEKLFTSLLTLKIFCFFTVFILLGFLLYWSPSVLAQNNNNFCAADDASSRCQMSSRSCQMGQNSISHACLIDSGFSD